jgi:hypothetical protein
VYAGVISPEGRKRTSSNGKKWKYTLEKTGAVARAGVCCCCVIADTMR